jgi:glycosyltransferase involved in cell wall biosynthesis
MEPISATLITCNEQGNIREALESLRWCSEIVVVDSGSTDRTVEFCRAFGARVLHRNWTGYADQKNYAVESANHHWIFSLDADERVSAALQSEIAAVVQDGLRCAGYRIPRVAFFMGRWIRHGDWYPDYQLRLFDRRRARWEGGSVHESVRVRGTVGVLGNDIQHYTYRTLSDYLRRLETYSTLAASDYLRKGRRSGPLRMWGHPVVTFVKAYLLKKGFLDGTPGLMVAIMGAVSVFFKYAKLYELNAARRASPALSGSAADAAPCAIVPDSGERKGEP